MILIKPQLIIIIGFKQFYSIRSGADSGGGGGGGGGGAEVAKL